MSRVPRCNTVPKLKAHNNMLEIVPAITLTKIYYLICLHLINKVTQARGMKHKLLNSSKESEASRVSSLK